MNKENYNFIQNKLLNILGLSIVDGFIYDEDKCGYLEYKGGPIKINTDGVFHKNYSVFNPVFDQAQAEYLFSILSSKEAEDNGLYINSLGGTNIAIPEGDKTLIKFKLNVNSNMGSFESDSYFNICLTYIEAIISLSSSYEYDKALQENLIPCLKSIDYTVEEMIERISNKRKG